MAQPSNRLLLIAGFAPGGGDRLGAMSRGAAPARVLPVPALDHFARLVQRQFGRFLPDNPQIELRHMPGGGGARAAQWLAGQGDDNVITILPARLYRNAALALHGADIELSGLKPLGGRIEEEFVFVCRDALRRWAFPAGTVFGAAGPGHVSYLHARWLQAASSVKFRLIPGFRDTGEALRAMQRGEIDAWCGLGWEEARGRLGHASSGITPFARLTAPGSVSRLPAVPDAMNFSSSPLWREASGFLAFEGALSAVLMVRSQTAAPIVAALRTGFAAMMRDAGVRREALRRNLGLDPVAPARIDQALTSMAALSPQARKALQDLDRGGE